MPLSLKEALDEVAGAGQAAAPADGLADEHAELQAVARQPVEPDLADLTPQDMGKVPLLGTALRAAAFPALLWNGERFERLGTAWTTRLTFLAATTAGADASDRSLTPAVRAGEALRRLWPPPAATGAVAGLTTDVVSAAVCAAMASGIPLAEYESVGELAANLMLVTPAIAEPQLAGLHAGHSLATAWLAVQLHQCGVIAQGGLSSDVLSTREDS